MVSLTHESGKDGSHLVMTAHQCRFYLVQSELEPCIIKRTVKRYAFLRIGGIIAMAVRMYAYER